MIDTAFLIAVRSVSYLLLMFLIIFDLPLVQERGHRMVLFAMIVLFAILFAATVSFVAGDGIGYVYIRDYAVTGALLGLVAAHLYWLNLRIRKRK